MTVFQQGLNINPSFKINNDQERLLAGTVTHKKPNQQLSNLCKPSPQLPYWLLLAFPRKESLNMKADFRFSPRGPEILYWLGSVTIPGRARYRSHLLSEVSCGMTQMLRRQEGTAYCGILGMFTLCTHSKLVSKHFLYFSQEHLSPQTQVNNLDQHTYWILEMLFTHRKRE